MKDGIFGRAPLQGRTGIASIHDTGIENDLCVNLDFERGQDLFRDLARELFSITPAGPVEWLAVMGAPAA